MSAAVRRARDYSVIWLIGSAGYSLIEILWRGFTHWTMAVTGGICFVVLYRLDRRHSRERLPFKCLRGAAAITAIEFLVGCIVNLKLHWQVWDYSGSFGNLLGQICPLYTIFWFFLCIPVYWLTGKIRNLLAKV